MSFNTRLKFQGSYILMYLNRGLFLVRCLPSSQSILTKRAQHRNPRINQLYQFRFVVEICISYIFTKYLGNKVSLCIRTRRIAIARKFAVLRKLRSDSFQFGKKKYGNIRRIPLVIHERQASTMDQTPSLERWVLDKRKIIISSRREMWLLENEVV